MTDKLGPYESNNIYCGECSQMMAALPDNCIDLTVTSPPYDNLRDYNGYEFNFEAIAKQLYRVTKVGGVVVWVVGDATINGSETGTSSRQALGFMEIGFKLHDTMIYHRQAVYPSNNRYSQDFEFMLVLAKKSVKIFNPLTETKKNNGHSGSPHAKGRDEKARKRVLKAREKKNKLQSNVWEIGRGYLVSSIDKEAYQHPAIFPEVLARDHIISWSNPGDLILDPMIGSGTTAKMAYQLQRNYLGFDISQEYVDLAKKRLLQTQPPLPMEVS